MKGLGYQFGRLMMAVTLVVALVAGSMSPAAAATVSKSFTTHSQASSSLLVVGGEQFTFAVSGTWVGTVKLQKSRNGADFKDVIGYEAVTANTSVTLTADTASGQRTYYRVYASTYTSGTIVTSLADVADVVQVFNSKRGDPVLSIADDGTTVTGTQSVSGNLTVGPGSLVKVSSSATSAFSLTIDGAYTTAQIQAKTPSRVGILIYNSTLNQVCVSSGTTIQGYKVIGTASTTCQ